MKTMHIRGRSIQVVNEFKNLGELSDTLGNFSYRVLKDCLDLPDKIFTNDISHLHPINLKFINR